MARARRTTRGWPFRTKQPHNFTWIIALVLAVLGLLGTHTHIDVVSPNAFWFEVAAYVALALGTVIDGL